MATRPAASLAAARRAAVRGRRKPAPVPKGNHTPSEEGGSKADQKGQGETGAKPGNQAKSDHHRQSGQRAIGRRGSRAAQAVRPARRPAGR